MKTEIITCDVCQNPAQNVAFKAQVIFHTEQTEGRGVDPYLSNEVIDICDACKALILKDNGNYLHANGAQGYNNYYFSIPKLVDYNDDCKSPDL